MFRTELKPSPPDFSIDLKMPILSLGSCFADEMGQRLDEHKFNISTNPGGILFNPISIFRLLEIVLKDEPLPEWSFIDREGITVNYLLHSDMNAAGSHELDEKFEALRKHLKSTVENAKVVIFTFGTAFVHKLSANGEIVANCHKVPQKQFEKALLSVEQIIREFEAVKGKIEAINQDAKFLLTVSPVRHTKEGLPENNVSKSTLRLACHHLTTAHNNVSYFPSYEIMMDDLRDYRFYKSDLIHPNEQALDYIWDQFSRLYFDQATQTFVSEWKKVMAAMNHDPFNMTSEAHQAFLSNTLEKVKNFAGQVDVEIEIEYLQGQLNLIKNAQQSPG